MSSPRQPTATGRWRQLFAVGIIVCQLSTSAQAVQTEANSPKQPASQAVAQNIDTLVFCPRTFQSSLTPWIEYRHKQGHRIQVLTPRPTAAELKQHIVTVAANNPLTHLVFDWRRLRQQSDSRAPSTYRVRAVTRDLQAWGRTRHCHG